MLAFSWVFNLISWKYSFEKISKDLELARKKKQALDDLFSSGKISASTYESLDKELTDVISEIEARQKGLADKITSKIADLEKQIVTLEMFLANSEIQYAAEEIDEELHANESTAFSLGLDAMKKQLATVKEVVASLMPEAVAPTPPSTPSETEEAPLTTEEIVEETTEIPVETPVEETPAEETTEVEPVSEEATIEAPLETPTEEIPTEEVTEETTEEVAEEEAPSEEVFEEPVVTEIPAETVTEEIVTEEEAVIEEETEASTEGTSSYEEEEATTEEEAYEDY